MSELLRFLEFHQEYSYLGSGRAKNKVEWVSKTMLLRKPLSLNIVTPRRKIMLERLVGHSFYCFLAGYSGYNQIVISPDD